MAGENRELQRIANEISGTLKQLVSSNRTLVGSMMKGDDQKAGKRRSTKGDGKPSPTAQMNINRRLTGSVTNLNKQVNTASSDMIKFARALRNATSHVNSQGSKQRPHNNAVAEHQLQGAISQFGRELREALDAQREGGGGGRSGGGGGETTELPDNQIRKLTDSIVGVLEKFTVTGGVVQGYKEVQMAASRGGIYDFQTQQDSIMMGMTASDLIELQADHRTSMLRATNGIDQWNSTIRHSQRDLIAYTGSLQDAAKVSATLQQGLLNVGFTFEEAISTIGLGDQGLVGSLKRLSMVTGKTVQDLSEMVGNIISTNDGTELLRRMDRTQRRDYINTQSRLLEHYTQLTGNIDRAAEIVSTQQQRMNVDPVTRYRDSVRAMQAAVQTGMSQTDARELQTLMSMNPTQVMQDPELNKRMTDLAGTLHQNITELRGNENMGVEWLGFKLDKWTKNANLEAFNIETDQPLSEANMHEQMDRSISTSIDTNDILKETLVWIQRIESLSKNILTAMVVGGAMTLFRSAGFKKMMAGAKASHTAARAGGNSGVGAASRNVAGAMNNRWMRAGGIGLLTAGASLAIDKMVTPESQEQERNKNMGRRALEMAGMGATIGTLIAGPIGTAVGGALGGVVGAIAGGLQQTTTQARYEADALNMQLSSDRFVMESTHDKMMQNLQAQRDEQQDLYNSASGEERELARKQLDHIDEQISKEEHLHRLRVEQVDKLSVATDQLINKLDAQRNLEDGFDAAFGKSLFRRQDQFDVGAFSEATNMTGSDIAKSIQRYVDVPQDQLADLHRQLVDPSSKIRDPELMAILEQWSSARVDEVTREAQEAKKAAEEARQDAAEAANAQSVVKDESGDLIFKPGDSEQYKMFDSPLETGVKTNFRTPSEQAEIREQNRLYHQRNVSFGMHGMPMRMPSSDPYTSTRRRNTTPISEQASNLGRSSEDKQKTVNVTETRIHNVEQQNQELQDKLERLINTTDIGWKSLADVINNNHRDDRQRNQQNEDNRNFVQQTTSDPMQFQTRTVR